MQVSGQAKERGKEENLDNSVLNCSAVVTKVYQGHHGVTQPKWRTGQFHTARNRLFSTSTSLSHGLEAAHRKPVLCTDTVKWFQSTRAGPLANYSPVIRYKRHVLMVATISRADYVTFLAELHPCPSSCHWTFLFHQKPKHPSAGSPGRTIKCRALTPSLEGWAHSPSWTNQSFFSSNFDLEQRDPRSKMEQADSFNNEGQKNLSDYSHYLDLTKNYCFLSFLRDGCSLLSLVL